MKDYTKEERLEHYQDASIEELRTNEKFLRRMINERRQKIIELEKLQYKEMMYLGEIQAELDKRK